MLLPTGFPEPTTVARITAKLLLEIEAVLFNAAEPFTFTSGRKSPVYVDIRRVNSFPRARSTVIDFATGTLLRDVGFESIDGVAGGETAGISYAALIADRLGLPMQYVRKAPKGFGRMAQIEGHLRDGARTVLVEDLQSEGTSKARFVDALRQAGAKVTDTFVIFHYGIFPQSLQTNETLGVRLHALTTWWDVLAVAREEKAFDEATLDAVERFLRDPHGWTA
jgi:orotate phosphoribosyltransferase